MTFPRPRFTVRGLMVAVAIVAGVAWMMARSRRAGAIAEFHRRQSLAPEGVRRVVLPGGGLRVSVTARGNWHSSLHVKYANAARYPWLPVAPDPPEPE